MPDALPAATLSLYPGLGQAPNMLACVPSGMVKIGPNTELKSKTKTALSTA